MSNSERFHNYKLPLKVNKVFIDILLFSRKSSSFALELKRYCPMSATSLFK